MRAIRGSSGTCWCGEVYSAGAMVVAAVEKDEQLALNRVGLVLIDPDNVQAAWVLRTTFWEQTFLPGKEIVSSTVTSRSVGQSFFGKESLALDSYNTKYCVDQDFVTAARAKLDQRTSPENPISRRTGSVTCSPPLTTGPRRSSRSASSSTRRSGCPGQLLR
jgi:Domain of unknown function (DUF4424)